MMTKCTLSSVDTGNHVCVQSRTVQDLLINSCIPKESILLELLLEALEQLTWSTDNLSIPDIWPGLLSMCLLLLHT